MVGLVKKEVHIETGHDEFRREKWKHSSLENGTKGGVTTPVSF